MRDFIHMDDVVDATLKAVELDIQGPVNLGLGRPTSFNELAEIVSNSCGYKPEIKHLTAAPVGVQYRVANPAKMLDFYTPKISLEEGVRLSIEGVTFT